MAYQPKHSAGQPKHMKQSSAATKTARAAGAATKSAPQVIKIVTDTGTVSGKKGAGISGSAVLFGTVGLYLIYVGIKKVPFLEGLRLLIKGQNPESLAQAKGSSVQPLDISAIAAAVAGAGPATTGVSSTTSPSPVPGQPTGPVSPNEITSVMGIRVHKSIAGNVSRMIAASQHDGIDLGAGGGYRSSLEQSALRIKNGCTCNNSSSCCRVPTAPVGKSMHERGLAIDFYQNANTRSKPAWKWLAKNASKYGFYNLPSEPWHWSTNGR